MYYFIYEKGFLFCMHSAEQIWRKIKACKRHFSLLSNKIICLENSNLSFIYKVLS